MATPTLTSISPNTAPAGSPDFTMTLTGTGFEMSSMLVWNGTVLDGANYVSPTEMTALISLADIEPGVVTVMVRNEDLSESETLEFTVGEAVPSLPGDATPEETEAYLIETAGYIKITPADPEIGPFLVPPGVDDGLEEGGTMSYEKLLSRNSLDVEVSAEPAT